MQDVPNRVNRCWVRLIPATQPTTNVPVHDRRPQIHYRRHLIRIARYTDRQVLLIDLVQTTQVIIFLVLNEISVYFYFQTSRGCLSTALQLMLLCYTNICAGSGVFVVLTYTVVVVAFHYLAVS